MRTVFTNSAIVHTFNQQNQSEGRTSSGGMYFCDTKLYSYGSHYLLCEFIDSNTVMINNKGYSKSTATHINLVTGATRDKKQFFATESDTFIVNNTIKEYINKLPRATKNKEWYKNQIVRLYANYIDYLTYSKKLTSSKKIKEHREILKLYEKFNSNYENLETEILAQQKRQRDKNKKEIAKKVIDWKLGKIDWFRNKTNTDFLRVIGDNVETSQNVKISIAEAKRLLTLLDSKNIVGEKVDNLYTVTAFNSLLKVGCHNIPLKEIKYIRGLI